MDAVGARDSRDGTEVFAGMARSYGRHRWMLWGRAIHVIGQRTK